jgi:hypothetical protein
MRLLTQNRMGWPFAIDQPLNIAYMARTLDVGFEFTEMRADCCPVKTENSESTPHDMGSWIGEARDFLDAAFGEIGQRKRENAVRIGENLGKAWAEKRGRARLDLSRFLDAMNI